MNTIYYTPRALKDLKTIKDYYYSVGSDYFSKLFSAFEERFIQIQNFPKSGRYVPEFYVDGIKNYREVIFENYRIVYQMIGSRIFILTIQDGRRPLNFIIS